MQVNFFAPVTECFQQLLHFCSRPAIQPAYQEYGCAFRIPIQYVAAVDRLGLQVQCNYNILVSIISELGILNSRAP